MINPNIPQRFLNKLINTKRPISLPTKFTHRRTIATTPIHFTPRSKKEVNFGEDFLNSNNKFGKYSLIVPGKLTLGVGNVDIDLVVPSNIIKPSYAYTKQPKEWSKIIQIKNEEQILKMKVAGKIAKMALKLGGEMCKVSSFIYI